MPGTEVFQPGGGGGGGTPAAHAASHGSGQSDPVAIDGAQVTSGTVADARVAATIARDAEVAALLTFPEGLSVNSLPTWIAAQNARALRRFRERVATADISPLRIYATGDSLTEGNGLTPPARWVTLVADAIADAVGLATASQGYTCAKAVLGAPEGVTGDAGTLNPNGIGYRSWLSASGVTNHRDFSLVCDRFRVFYNKGSARGKISVTVDGGAPVAFDTWQAGAGPTAAVWDSFTDGGITLAVGTHTIVLTSQNTGTGVTFAVDIAGVFPFESNFSAGVQVYNAGHALSGSWVPGVSPSTGNELAHITLVDPDIVLIGFGANDNTLGVNVATMKANFLAAKTAFEGAVSHPISVVFVATWGVNVDSVGTWEPYANAIHEAAVESGAAFVNLYTALGKQSAAGTVLSDTTGHPTADGAQAWRDAILYWLGFPAPRAQDDAREYTAAGTYTWVKPKGAKTVIFEAIAPGGGGAGGRRGAAAAARAGGGGGAAGCAVRQIFAASELPATVTITIGAPGTAGAAATVDSTYGTDGGDGGDVVFGALVTVKGGKGASHGAAFTPGAGGRGGPSELNAGPGGSSIATLGQGTPLPFGFHGLAGGGGAGAQITAGDAVASGWAGGDGLGGVGGVGVLATNGTAGTNGTKMRGGGGGAGGASRKDGVAAAYSGGAGATPGGGGGGGGAGLNGQNSGAGAAGGGAYVRITTSRG